MCHTILLEENVAEIIRERRWERCRGRERGMEGGREGGRRRKERERCYKKTH